MRSKVIVAVVLVVVAMVGYLVRRRETDTPRSERDQAQSAAITPTSPRSTVRRLATGERKQLGEDIRVAIEKARSNPAAENLASGGAAPALSDEPLLRLDDVGPNVKAALDATIPEFAKCYEGKVAANKSPIAIMEMVSDPELGTVIDTTQMIDPDGNPLPKDIDDCLRETADSLSLPPLGKPGRLPIQYSFHFH